MQKIIVDNPLSSYNEQLGIAKRLSDEEIDEFTYSLENATGKVFMARKEGDHCDGFVTTVRGENQTIIAISLYDEFSSEELKEKVKAFIYG